MPGFIVQLDERRDHRRTLADVQPGESRAAGTWTDVQMFLPRLRPLERDAMRLRYADGLRQHEIGAVLGTTQAAVSYLLKRARQRIQYWRSAPEFDRREAWRDLVRKGCPPRAAAVVVRWIDSPCRLGLSRRHGIPQPTVSLWLRTWGPRLSGDARSAWDHAMAHGHIVRPIRLFKRKRGGTRSVRTRREKYEMTDGRREQIREWKRANPEKVREIRRRRDGGHVERARKAEARRGTGRRLTPEERAEIRRLHAEDGAGSGALCRRFGVSRTLIRFIIGKRRRKAAPVPPRTAAMTPELALEIVSHRREDPTFCLKDFCRRTGLSYSSVRGVVARARRRGEVP